MWFEKSRRKVWVLGASRAVQPWNRDIGAVEKAAVHFRASIAA